MAEVESTSSAAATEVPKMELPPSPLVQPVISPRSLEPIRTSSLSTIPQLPDPANIPFDAVHTVIGPFSIGVSGSAGDHAHGHKRKHKRHLPPSELGTPYEPHPVTNLPEFPVGGEGAEYPSAYYLPHGYPYGYYPPPPPFYYGAPSHHHHGGHHPLPEHGHPGHDEATSHPLPGPLHAGPHVPEPPPPAAVPPVSHAALVSKKAAKAAIKHEIRRQLRARSRRAHRRAHAPPPPPPSYYDPYYDSGSDSDSEDSDDELGTAFSGLGLGHPRHPRHPHPHHYPYNPYPYAYYPPPAYYPPSPYYYPYSPYDYTLPSPHQPHHQPHSHDPHHQHHSHGPPPPVDPKHEKLVRIESGKPPVPKPRAITDKNPWWNKAWRHTSMDPQSVEPYAVRLDENGEEIPTSATSSNESAKVTEEEKGKEPEY